MKLKQGLHAFRSFFKIDLCSAISMEISCRDLFNDMAEHTAILKKFQNTYHPRFSFIPKTGISFPKMGAFLLWNTLDLKWVIHIQYWFVTQTQQKPYNGRASPPRNLSLDWSYSETNQNIWKTYIYVPLLYRSISVDTANTKLTDWRITDTVLRTNNSFLWRPACILSMHSNKLQTNTSTRQNLSRPLFTYASPLLLMNTSYFGWLYP